MVGSGIAEGWVKGLDDMASGNVSVGGKMTIGRSATGIMTTAPTELEERVKREMAVVRERWVGEVGWLVGRRLENLQRQENHQHQQQQHQQHDMMEEEEEL